VVSWRTKKRLFSCQRLVVPYFIITIICLQLLPAWWKLWSRMWFLGVTADFSVCVCKKSFFIIVYPLGIAQLWFRIKQLLSSSFYMIHNLPSADQWFSDLIRLREKGFMPHFLIKPQSSGVNKFVAGTFCRRKQICTIPCCFQGGLEIKTLQLFSWQPCPSHKTRSANLYQNPRSSHVLDLEAEAPKLYKMLFSLTTKYWIHAIHVN
jgi:hypothetical protein